MANRVEVYSTTCIDDTFDSFIDSMLQLRDDCKGKFSDLKIELDTEYGYYDDSYSRIIVSGKKI
jgi:hypothetical protein